MKLLKYCMTTIMACLGALSTLQARNEIVVNIENEAVRKMMTTSNATFSAEESNIAQSFYDEARNYRPDQPQGAVVTFRCKHSASARVYLSTQRNMKKADFIGEFPLHNGVGECSLRNFIPGVTYYYKVIAESGRTIAKGSIVPTGQVRMIGIDSGFNIRDLGGWRGLGDRSVRYGSIYRGGSLGGTDKFGNRSTITPADQAELYRVGIRAHLDLRAKTDAGKYAGEKSLHSYSAGETTLLHSDFNNTMTDYGAYNEDATVISDIAWIIHELRHNRPIYFNCRQGADRTGTIAFVIEGLLGCYQQANDKGANQMAIDYELTGFSQANSIDNKKVSTSCRPATEAYGNKDKLFRKLIDLQATEPDIHLTSIQEKCYYYLNRYRPTTQSPALNIDSDDLDWFITYMLRMTPQDYAPYKPVWGIGGPLPSATGEVLSNVVKYAPCKCGTHN